MGNTPAYYIVLGLVLGAIVGAGVGVISGDAVHAMQLGALAGLFIGWVIAASAVPKPPG